MRILNSLIIAFSTYSRLPMPQVEWSEENRRYTMCFFPLIGAVIGALLWLWLTISEKLALGQPIKGALGAIIPLLVTGGIHMDGFMDTTDALSSWQPKEKKLEILKDSHVGAFAVMGCAGYLLRAAALMSCAKAADGPSFIAAFMASRCLSALALALFKPARPGGMLSSFAEAAGKRALWISTAVYLPVCIFLWCLNGVWLAVTGVLASTLMTLFYRRMAYKQFGGVTGDLAGWFSQMTELVLIAAIVIGGKSL